MQNKRGVKGFGSTNMRRNYDKLPYLAFFLATADPRGSNEEIEHQQAANRRGYSDKHSASTCCTVASRETQSAVSDTQSFFLLTRCQVCAIYLAFFLRGCMSPGIIYSQTCKRDVIPVPAYPNNMCGARITTAVVRCDTAVVRCDRLLQRTTSLYE